MIVGVLAAVAASRQSGNLMDARGFRDEVVSALQHAHHLANTSRRYVCVTVNPGTGPAAYIALQFDTTAPESLVTVSCTTALALPAGRGCASNQICAPSNITLGGGGLIFNPYGQVVASDKSVLSVDSTLTVSDQTAITIVSETGYVQ